MTNLFEKYNQQAPRYTSYPAMPYWKGNMSEKDWFECLGKGLSTDPTSDVYIHVPFCAKLCWYCGCNRVITKNQSEGDRYLDGLLKELEVYLQKFPQLQIRSLHLGGGTPNFLTPKQLDRMLSPFAPYFTSEFEGAIEVDPRTCHVEQLELLAHYGFNRISFGVQDFDTEVQKAINRVQSFEMVERVCAQAREAGFKHVNFDLIWGLPKQSPKTIERTVGLSEKLSPDQISFYSYAHLPSRFKHQNLIKASDILQGEKKRELYDTGKAYFEKAGYVEIGMDHYAKKGSVLDKASQERRLTRNFMGYTDKKADNLIGLGASAISSNGYGYVQNDKDVEKYLAKLGESKIPLVNGHLKLGEDDCREKLIQDLMCNLKVDIHELERLENADELKETFTGFMADGLLSLNEERYLVSPLGRTFIRSIACSLDPYYQLSMNQENKFSKTI